MQGRSDLEKMRCLTLYGVTVALELPAMRPCTSIAPSVRTRSTAASDTGAS